MSELKSSSLLKKSFSWSELFWLVVQFLLIILNFLIIGHFNLKTMDSYVALNSGLGSFGMIISFFIYYSTMINNSSSSFRKKFLILSGIETLLLFLDNLGWIIEDKEIYYQFLVYLLNFNFILGTILVSMFWSCQIEVFNLKDRYPAFFFKAIKIIAVLQVLFFIVNIFTGTAFYFASEDCSYHQTGFYFLALFYFFLIYILIFYFSLKTKIGLKMKMAFIFVVLIHLFAVILENIFWGLSLEFLAILTGIFALYINVNVELEKKFEEAKNKIMISQIQPHFMYNTLSTIKALCYEDPDLTAKTIENFADYLRENMDFAGRETMIPVSDEIKHTKIYTEIEKLRFDNITFEFIIEDDNFEIPALSIQPMVENSVRHGVRLKKDAKIIVHTFEDKKYHNVIIKDNGKGFDKTQFNGSRSHIGLMNTKLRIERLAFGKFYVESISGEGVTIKILIPKAD